MYRRGAGSRMRGVARAQMGQHMHTPCWPLYPSPPYRTSGAALRCTAPCGRATWRRFFCSSTTRPQSLVTSPPNLTTQPQPKPATPRSGLPIRPRGSVPKGGVDPRSFVKGGSSVRERGEPRHRRSPGRWWRARQWMPVQSSGPTLPRRSPRSSSLCPISPISHPISRPTCCPTSYLMLPHWPLIAPI